MIYEYRCNECKLELEVEQRMKDEALTTCPSCAGEALVRLVTGGGGFILRGQGWYKDGYASPVPGQKKGPKDQK